MITGEKTTFLGRERDVCEVRNYWNALLRVEEWSAHNLPVSEHLIQKLHALVEKGGRAKPTPYRTHQNVIKDSNTGKIVYLPPEAKDVPKLMSDLAHYQFVTIHPYYDGNGRTARLLATLLLQRGGYGLNGFLSIEEQHARDLDLCENWIGERA